MSTNISKKKSKAFTESYKVDRTMYIKFFQSSQTLRMNYLP